MTDPDELREQIFGGDELRDSLRDIVARNNTGYTYKELESEDCAEIGELDYQDELMEVDKTVNLLTHAFKYHSQRIALETLISLRKSWQSQYVKLPVQESESLEEFLDRVIEVSESKLKESKK